MRAPILHSSHWSRIFSWYAPPPPRSHPLLSSCSSHHSFIPTSTCPPIEALFHPPPGPFHPSPALWSLIISSFHKSNLTSLLPPIRLSFFAYSAPPPIPRGARARNMWPAVWRLAGDLLRQCHRTLICLLRSFIDFVLNKWKIQEEWGARGDRK